MQRRLAVAAVSLLLGGACASPRPAPPSAPTKADDYGLGLPLTWPAERGTAEPAASAPVDAAPVPAASPPATRSAQSPPVWLLFQCGQRWCWGGAVDKSALPAPEDHESKPLALPFVVMRRPPTLACRPRLLVFAASTGHACELALREVPVDARAVLQAPAQMLGGPDEIGRHLWRVATPVTDLPDVFQPQPPDPLAPENIDYTLRRLQAFYLLQQLLNPARPAWAGSLSDYSAPPAPLFAPRVPNRSALPLGPNPAGLLGPWRPNAYGPGINSDATGRPFTWQPQPGGAPVLGPVRPDAYGPGIGMDATGQPVQAQPWP